MAELFDNWVKPDWDSYFMGFALLASVRSIDPSTKHGAVVVKDKIIIGTGYNGPPRGCDDSLIPLTRPEKYNFMEHAEANALHHLREMAQGSTLYVTGVPCIPCFRTILQTGVRRVVYGDISSVCVEDKDKKARDIMMSGRKDFSFERFGGDMTKSLRMALDYYARKGKD